MSTVDELLATTSEKTEEILVADLTNRVIVIPATLKILGVESDDDVRRLHFSIPRYYGEVDLSEFKININFENAKGEGDFWPVDDLVINEDDTLTFSWLIDRSALKYAGNVSFNLCMKKYNTEGIVVKELNTTPSSLPVLKGLETSKEVVENNPSAFDAVLFRLYAVEEAVNGFGGSGSKAFIVYVTETDGRYTADKTPSEIYAAHNSGAPVLASLSLVGGVVVAYLVVAQTDTAIFQAPDFSYGDDWLGEDSIGVTVIISGNDPADRSVTIVETTGEGGTVTDEQIEKAVEDYFADHPIEVPDSGGNVDVTFEGETMIISTANNAVKIDGETLIL